MHLNLTPDQEAQLSRLAGHQGLKAEELATNVLLRMLEDEEQFLAAVQLGIDQANRGEFLPHDDVKERIHRLLRQ